MSEISLHTGLVSGWIAHWNIGLDWECKHLRSVQQ